MIEFILFFAVVWLVLTLLQPLWAAYSAKRECDRKYGPRRAERARQYEEMLRKCRSTPIIPNGDENKCNINENKIRRKRK